MKLASLSTRRIIALAISGAIETAGLSEHTHQAGPNQFLAILPTRQPDGVILTGEFITDPPLFAQIRQTSPTAKIILCLLPDSTEPSEALWPSLDKLDFDVLCYLDELSDCLTTLKSGHFFSSSFLKTLPTGPKKKETLPGFNELTPMEKQVLSLMIDGLNGPAIARKLFISTRTVDHHKEHLIQKLGVPAGQGELAAFIIQNILILKKLLEI
jgi:DNA-binding NarL/FixJ family response regulator